MGMDIERYLDISSRVDLSGIEFGSAPQHPLTRDEVRCLIYMMDVESHTIVYLRGLLNTCAIEDPDIAAFLPCWAYEELFHGRALRQFLEVCGVPLSRGRMNEVRKSASVWERIEEVGASLVCKVTPHLAGAYLSWGAIQELCTLEGYGVLARRTSNGVLAEILRRIIKDERRHFSFYYNKARIALQSTQAQRITSFLLRSFWSPVGQGVKLDHEVQWMMRYLFSDAPGTDCIQRIDTTIGKLPGLGWFDLLKRAARA